MDYGDSVQKVLLRKIQKAEQDLIQLKLDYCRFVFGLTHRARVVSGDKTWLVRSVDVESMVWDEQGTFTKPVITGIPADDETATETASLGNDWSLASAK
ncbi:MAG TPA: hypothetical protein VFM78_06335 [Marinobacter sp.]|nr:hypothetical protein [Marinobacter sp.]